GQRDVRVGDGHPDGRRRGYHGVVRDAGRRPAEERVRGHRVRRDVDHGAEVAAAVADVHLGPVRRDGDPGRGFPGAEDRADRVGRRVDHGYATRDAGDVDVPAV